MQNHAKEACVPRDFRRQFWDGRGPEPFPCEQSFGEYLICEGYMVRYMYMYIYENNRDVVAAHCLPIPIQRNPSI